MSGLSKLDLLYRQFVLTKFYTKGWGNPEDLKEILAMHKLISNRKTCCKLVHSNYEVKINEEIQQGNCNLIRGSFVTPMMNIIPRLIPKEIKLAHFEVVVPKTCLFKSHKKVNPACIHMAGTGDHGYSRRRDLIARPLSKSGITSILLENPFYGVRKPSDQWKSGLLRVSDLFIMGGCLILEAQVLLHWLKRQGFGPLGLTGISMGGHMASLAATNWPEPIALIPCMSWTSASVVWTDGVLSKAVPWRILESQYSTNPKYEEEILEMLDQVDSYKLGQNFAKGCNTEVHMKAAEGDVRSTHTAVNQRNKQRRQQETIHFMRGVMDQVTHLANFSKPVDPSLVTFVVAKGDAYFPKSNLQSMDLLWPECQVREIDGGHIAGILIHYPECTKAIIDTFERMIKKQDKLQENENTSDMQKNISLYYPKSSRIALAYAIKVWLKALTVKS